MPSPVSAYPRKYDGSRCFCGAGGSECVLFSEVATMGKLKTFITKTCITLWSFGLFFYPLILQAIPGAVRALIGGNPVSLFSGGHGRSDAERRITRVLNNAPMLRFWTWFTQTLILVIPGIIFLAIGYIFIAYFVMKNKPKRKKRQVFLAVLIVCLVVWFSWYIILPAAVGYGDRPL